MQTLKEKILDMEIKVTSERLEVYNRIEGCPQIIKDNLNNLLYEYENGNIKISGNKELLNVQYKNHEVKTGRGGKQYIAFNNGTINYFPQARYGKCIYSATEG